jgi:hypothetical protein
MPPVVVFDTNVLLSALLSLQGTPFRFADAAEKPCPECGRLVYLTDTFRFHERIDEELGAGGITAYVLPMLEHLVLVHLF